MYRLGLMFCFATLCIPATGQVPKEVPEFTPPEEYVLLRSEGGRDLYLHGSIMRQEKALPEFTILSVQRSTDPEGYLMISQTYRANCDENSILVIGSTAKKTGYEAKNFPAETEWQMTAPDTVTRSVVNLACEQVAK